MNGIRLINHNEIVIDSIVLLDFTMLWCRHGGVEAANHLQTTLDVLAEVERQGHLIVTMPIDWVSATNQLEDGILVREIHANRFPVADLSADTKYLLAILEHAASEMLELCASNSDEMIRSLGYALHPLCNLIRSDEPVIPSLFQFNFRIAAMHWGKMSVDLRQSLCDLANYTLEEAEALIAQEGFVIDMWHKR